MPIYSRRQIAAHYRELLKRHPRDEAIHLTAAVFCKPVATIEEVIKQAAVTAYMHVLGLVHAPAAEVLAEAAVAYGLEVPVLLAAVEEQRECMEA